jgi:hypothetical protein
MTFTKLLDFKFRRFSPGKIGQDGKIKENWSRLIKDAKICDPVSRLLNFLLSLMLLINH